jgi:hypothetical protein
VRGRAARAAAAAARRGAAARSSCHGQRVWPAAGPPARRPRFGVTPVPHSTPPPPPPLHLAAAIYRAAPGQAPAGRTRRPRRPAFELPSACAVNAARRPRRRPRCQTGPAPAPPAGRPMRGTRPAGPQPLPLPTPLLCVLPPRRARAALAAPGWALPLCLPAGRRPRRLADHLATAPHVSMQGAPPRRALPRPRRAHACARRGARRAPLRGAPHTPMRHPGCGAAVRRGPPGGRDVVREARLQATGATRPRRWGARAHRAAAVGAPQGGRRARRQPLAAAAGRPRVPRDLPGASINRSRPSPAPA